MIISLCGTPGSGKTSVCDILSKGLGWPVYSIGAIRGKMAQERGMTLDEFNALGEKESFTDIEVDDYQKALGEKEDHFVIEGRLAWHFIPHSFKVLLTCDTQSAAERIYKARQEDGSDREDEPEYTSVEETKRHIEERMKSDDLRYQKYYGISYLNHENYDLVVDTTDLPHSRATARVIIEALFDRGLIDRERFSPEILEEIGL